MANRQRTLELLHELRGTTCVCGSEKTSGQTFCRRCYFSLPKDLRSPLYSVFGEGYAEAYGAATKFLDSGGTDE